MINYKTTGKCIWCGKCEPYVTFDTAPHILPKKLGGMEIGFDVCDDCNHYFGTSPGAGYPSIDLAFKEVIGAFRMFCKELNKESYKKFSSVFFNYYHGKHLIKIKNSFDSAKITRQFKRGLYEVFLQKYHEVTKDGNNPIFNDVRNFARFNKGDLHVFFVYNNMVLMPDNNSILHPKVNMNDKAISEITKYGMFSLYIMGQMFFLEVLPLVANVYMNAYLLKQQHWIIKVKGDEGIYELKDIMNMDIFMQRFNSK